MLASVLLAGLATLATASPLGTSPPNLAGLLGRDLTSGCSKTGTASCQNTSAVADLCCFESPGGLLMLTQFWDTNPVTGPTNSWTIHGLWPDHCDGTFDETCDSKRAYTNMTAILNANGASDTLNFLKTYWVDIDGDNESFWEHEWGKHGTCMSTFRPSCVPSSTPGSDATAYLQTVVRLFKTLPTYTWLANAGITPSISTALTKAKVAAAIKSSWGFTPQLDCSSGKLNHVAYYFNLRGSAIDGTFVPINAPSAGSCPSSNIIYYPKTTGTNPTTTRTTTGSTPTTTGGALPAKATINALQSGTRKGGLLSLGTWSTQTLATYTLTGTVSSFTMSSSKGKCGVVSGAISCNTGVTPSTFSAVSSGGNLLLASGGSTAFTSDGTPSGATVYTVYTGSARAQDYTLAIVGV